MSAATRVKMARRCNDHPESTGKNAAASQSTEESTPSAVSGKLMCFTHDEVMTLIEAFQKQKDVLLDPDKRHVHSAFKRDAWLDISKTVNSKNPTRQRTVLQLKEKWKGLLKIARRDYDVVKQAAWRMEPAPEIGRYSELIWDIYGSKIESRFKYRTPRSRTSIPPSKTGSQSSSSRRPPTSAEYSYSESDYEDGFEGGGNEFDHAGYISQPHRAGSGSGYSDLEASAPVDMSEDDYDTDTYNPPSPQKKGSDGNQANEKSGTSKTWKDHKEEFDELMEGDDGDVPHDDEEHAYPTKTFKDGDVLYFDDKDMESMRRSLMRAKMSMIALQKARIESEMEKLDLEKEKIKLEKQKVELEMFLIRQKMNTLSVEETPITVSSNTQ